MTQNEFLFNTPILLITFNRIEETKKVFNVIKQVKPKKLYISSDGPRDTVLDENLKIQEIRNWIIENVDWECNLKTLFRSNNLGCKYGVSSSIDWFFDSEEYGIILEDDTVPNLDFFYFLDHCLLKYNNEPNIMMITGTNHLNKMSSSTPSYFLSNIISIWGWGTWRRAWLLYDVEMENYKDINLIRILKERKTANFIIRGLKDIFRITNSSLVDTWDYQWLFTCLLNQGLCITPKVNLIENIGVVGVHHKTRSPSHFRKTHSFPKDIYNDLLLNIDPNLGYDSKINSKNWSKSKIYWVVIIYLLKKFKLYSFSILLKRKLYSYFYRYL